MTQRVYSEQGSMLLEAVISAGLFMITAVTVVTFMQHALKGEQILRRLLIPSCEQPRCTPSNNKTTCTCSEHSSLVLH